LTDREPAQRAVHRWSSGSVAFVALVSRLAASGLMRSTRCAKTSLVTMAKSYRIGAVKMEEPPLLLPFLLPKPLHLVAPGYPERTAFELRLAPLHAVDQRARICKTSIPSSILGVASNSKAGA
jgi:hypothetical protein